MYQNKTDGYDYWHVGSLMVFHYNNPVMTRWGLRPFGKSKVRLPYLLSLGRWVIWFR